MAARHEITKSLPVSRPKAEKGPLLDALAQATGGPRIMPDERSGRHQHVAVPSIRDVAEIVTERCLCPTLKSDESIIAHLGQSVHPRAGVQGNIPCESDGLGVHLTRAGMWPGEDHLQQSTTQQSDLAEQT